MLTRLSFAIGFLVLTTVAAQAQLVPQRLEPYPLPPKTQRALADLASQSDILILGETHGTQEVPAVASALLTPLTKLGYGVLALEIPFNEQEPLTDWASGKTDRVPSFFTEPFPDGRANCQALSLIRTTLSPPFNWRLICFDESSQSEDGTADTEQQPASPQSVDDSIAISLRRDATMASTLGEERLRLAPDRKVLAICGNVHARTSNPRQTNNDANEPRDNLLHKLWPSFAARLQSCYPAWRVRSVNIVLHSGGYFAMTASDDGKLHIGVHAIRPTHQFDEAEARPLQNDAWNWELNLPRATPATFLKTPVDPQAVEPTPDS